MAYPHPRPGFWPGIERHAHGLALGLHDAGCKVTVVTSFRNGGSGHETHDGIDIVQVRDASLRMGKLAYLLSFHVIGFARTAARSDVLAHADVVISFVPLPRRGGKARSAQRQFAIFTHEERIERLRDLMVHPMRRWLDRDFFARAYVVLAATEASRAVLIDRFHVPADRIEVVPLGVHSQFMIDAHEIGMREANKGPDANIQVLSVGPLIRRKGLATLLDAIAILEPLAPNCRFVVVGSGPERRALEHRARHLGIAARVHFTGRVAEDELHKHYRTSDILVFPSRREGFGLVLGEAMASGLPIVASDVAPIPEVVGDAGSFFRPDDAEDLARKLEALLQDRAARARMSDAGVRRVREHFTWDRVARSVLQIIGQ